MFLAGKLLLLFSNLYLGLLGPVQIYFMKTQIILRKLKLFYGNSNYFTETQIILRKLKLFYKNSNYFTKSQIILQKLKLFYENSNYFTKTQIILWKLDFFCKVSVCIMHAIFHVMDLGESSSNSQWGSAHFALWHFIHHTFEQKHQRSFSKITSTKTLFTSNSTLFWATFPIIFCHIVWCRQTFIFLSFLLLIY